MWKAIGTITILALVLGSGVPAQAQTGERILDTLTDLVRGGNQHVRGYVVAVHDADMVVRGGDDHTYVISTAAIDRQKLTRFEPGNAVKVSVKRGAGEALVASAVEPDNAQPRPFRTANGKVESQSGGRIQFRTSEGFVVPLDLNQLVGTRPTFPSGEPATLIYEQTGQNPITAVWIEAGPSLGAASPRTGAAPTQGYERIHGYVQSIGIGSLTLKVDDGRTVMVDLGNARGGDVRPGDLVNVIGRPSGDRFLAEAIQRN